MNLYIFFQGEKMLAYILVSLNEPNEGKILSTFSEMPEVLDAHILFGEWDLLLKVKLDSPEDVGSFVIDKVRSLEEVGLTSTLIVAK